MKNKLFFVPLVFSIIFYGCSSHAGFWKYIANFGNSIVAQSHAEIAQRKYSNLSEQQEQQLEKILPVIGAHELLATLYENQERWSCERAKKDYQLVAILPGLLVATQMWRSINFKGKTDGLIACALLGLATWFSSSECMKRYPSQSCQFFPNVFIPRFCMVIYENICKLGARYSRISPEAMRTAYHKTNGIHDMSDRTKQFTRDLDSIVAG